ncbi:nucleotide exchange factor GrpE [Crenothrix polyspora]|uniref:GrpE protein n=1 Tax=Crenothrix polyspora TaxID=360316 RepID=A0A1R4HDH6_9GAMM|nr:nucleotide exchange factor GrpE [Crenothrix polyspora]SJM94257.1 GrpE protein [Crenothrix polyspora]
MSDAHKNRLLEEFQSYLQNVDFSQLAEEQPPDLNSLLNELASLKSEVKAQSRHFKSTLDALAEAVTVLQADNTRLTAELCLHDTYLQQQRNTLLRTLLTDIVDVYDRLGVGLAILQNHKPVSSFFGKKPDDRFLNSVKDGQAITLKRLENLLQRHHVLPIECVGKAIDPHTMNAVEIGNNPKLANGVVIEELRKGFLFENDVLRLAEVKVNKL